MKDEIIIMTLLLTIITISFLTGYNTGLKQKNNNCTIIAKNYTTIGTNNTLKPSPMTIKNKTTITKTKTPPKPSYLTQLITNYSISNRNYTWNYTCVNYAADLEAIIEDNTKLKVGMATLYMQASPYHAMPAIKYNETIYYIEPQEDEIFTAKEIFDGNTAYAYPTTRIVSRWGVETNPKQNYY